MTKDFEITIKFDLSFYAGYIATAADIICNEDDATANPSDVMDTTEWYMDHLAPYLRAHMSDKEFEQAIERLHQSIARIERVGRLGNA